MNMLPQLTPSYSLEWPGIHIGGLAREGSLYWYDDYANKKARAVRPKEI